MAEESGVPGRNISSISCLFRLDIVQLLKIFMNSFYSSYGIVEIDKFSAVFTEIKTDTTGGDSPWPKRNSVAFFVIYVWLNLCLQKLDC